MMYKMQHIKVAPDTIQVTDNEMYTVTRKIYAQTVDMVDDAIVRACYEAAKEAGITDLYLVDKAFVTDALKRAAGVGRWVPNGIPDSILSMCSVCGFPCGAHSFKFCPNCGTRMDGDQQ